MRYILLSFLFLAIVTSIDISSDDHPQPSDAPNPVYCVGECAQGSPLSLMSRVMHLKLESWEKCSLEHECPKAMADQQGPVPCVNNKALQYECCNVDLLSFVSLKSLGAGGDGNDVWGWESPDGKEFAIMGVYDGTSFVDVTDPTNPKVLGFLRTNSRSGTYWRDIKVYQNRAYIISEATSHGMQVFDLTILPSLSEQTVSVFHPDFAVEDIRQFTANYTYGEFGSCHNIAINEETGFAYAVGSKTCSGGLHMVDIRNPQPKYAGCFSQDGYVHDTQCVVYKGPDQSFRGKEICFCYDEDTLTIADVTVKTAPVMLSRVGYTGSQYTHQGWLLDDNQDLLCMDDELDELYNSNHHTRTMVWSVASLKNPVLLSSFYSSKTVIDHNLYTKDQRVYQANYCGGLRILDSSKVRTQGAPLSEAGYFDIAPDCDTREFLGSWSNYPYFKSGTILVSGIESGLYSVKYNGLTTC